MKPEELNEQRGGKDGKGKGTERVYDYDVYNDLGDPTHPDKQRPVLGYGKSGKGKFPYPR